jgi:hypothetical protein
MSAPKVEPPPPFPIVPGPWECRSDSYWLLYHHSGPLPEYAYAPLEASSADFSGPNSGQFKGGWATIQINHYLETPVGPYDEMVLIPGNFQVPPDREGKKGPSNIRITRAYVNQKETTFNGVQFLKDFDLHIWSQLMTVG